MNRVRIAVEPGANPLQRVVVVWQDQDVIERRTQDIDDDDAPAVLLPPGAPGGFAADLREILDRLGRRQGEAGDVNDLGTKLFDSLVGQQAWDTAVGAPGEPILLELVWAAGDGVMNALPWEAMRDASGFLAGRGNHEVAIVRVVPDAAAVATPVDRPPRVLFAIGNALDDAQIRAGAEVLGVLREVDHHSGRMISYVVDEVDVDKLRAATACFRPDAVHLIAHGGRNSKLEPGVLMRPINAAAGAAPDVVEGARLQGALTFVGEDGHSRLPDVVVLSSCDTARAWNDAGTPLAADLVSRGVPVVVAMGGRVRDDACRLFARGFGRGLVSGLPIATAAAEGRRAAFDGGFSPSSTIDWALPTVLLSEATDPCQPLVDPGLTTTLPGLLEVLDVAEQQSAPVFFGRRKFFRHLDDLLEGRERTLIALMDSDPEGLGGRRLLRELARTAIARGFVPVFPDQEQATTTTGGLLIELELDALRKRRELQLPIGDDFTLALLGGLGIDHGPADGPRKSPYSRLVAALKRARKEIDPDDLADVVKDVAADLIQFARDAGPLLPGAASDASPIIFLGGLERLATDVDRFFASLAGERQIGDAGRLIPIVATATSTALINERRSKRPRWVVFEYLRDFDWTVGEDVFAYGWVLMHPRPGFWWPPAQTQAWKFEPDDESLTRLRSLVPSPRPGMFENTLYHFVNESYGATSCNDEELLPIHLRLQVLP